MLLLFEHLQTPIGSWSWIGLQFMCTWRQVTVRLTLKIDENNAIDYVRDSLTIIEYIFLKSTGITADCVT